jgi:hypothetical protein
MSDWNDDPFAGEASAGNGQAARSTGFTLTRLVNVELDTGPCYVIDGLIPRNGLILVWGPPKCGKTFWVFDLVGHVAIKAPYLERDVEPGPVVYIACEGEHGVRTVPLPSVRRGSRRMTIRRSFSSQAASTWSLISTL